MVATGSAFPAMPDSGTSTASPATRSPFSRQRLLPSPLPEASHFTFSPIARRLALSVALVALVALSIFASATWLFVRNDVSTLTRQQEQDLGSAVEGSLALRYSVWGSWKRADLSAPLTLATQAGLSVVVRDATGAVVRQVAPANLHPGTLGPALDLPVVDHGTRVGSVTVRTGTTGIGGTAASLRSALTAALWWSAALAGALAIIAGIFVGRRITRPVVALTAASRAMASGVREARVGDIRAEGELAELSDAFDQMAETLEREAELRQHLAADVAHELRTPLAILQATTEAMADGVTEPNASALASLHEETLRLGRIVQDLEVLASAEAASLNLELEPVDLAGVVASVAVSLGALARDAGLSLVHAVKPVVVLGDANRLHQIFTNLLANAIKFTPAGGTIQMSVLPKDGVAWASVEDSGVGIAQADLPYVFERFWRGRAPSQIAGSGIGLAVVHELVLAHGGEISVTSKVGHGSTFVVTLPRA